MAEVMASMYLNLRDLAERYSDKQILKIAEVLSAVNPIIEDMHLQEANQITGNVSAIRTGLPDGVWRKLYNGIQPSKSEVTQVTDTCGSLERYSEIDKDLLSIQPNPKQFRADEDMAFLAGMTKQIAHEVFYGEKDGKSFHGLTSRYSTLNAKVANSKNIIDAGGTGSKLTSIWICTWGGQTLYGFYPRGSKAGFEMTDKGLQDTLAPDGNGKYPAYLTHYAWKLGLTLRDWRYVVRIANIDTEHLEDVNLTNLVIKALNKLPNLNMGKVIIYCNEDILTALDIERVNKTNMNLTLREFAGAWVLNARGVPIHKCDAIESKEKAVTAAA